MKPLLSDRNIALLANLALIRIATTEQIAQHFLIPHKRQINPDKNHPINTAKILARLEKADFVTRNFLYSTETSKTLRTRPKSVWFITGKNLKAIRLELSNMAKADTWESCFSDADVEARSASAFQQNTLGHEIGITACFLHLQYSDKPENVHLPVWLRTSPSHKLVSTHVTAKITPVDKTKKPYEKKLPVNPDGVFFIYDGTEYTFYFLEFDNNTETTHAKITNKYLAYQAFNKQQLFKKEILPGLIHTYGLDIPEDARVGSRVLFVATNENRRNALFIRSTLLDQRGLFLFTTLEELERAPWGAHWLANKHFDPFFDAYWGMAEPENTKQPKARPSVLRTFRDESIAKMKKIAIP